MQTQSLTGNWQFRQAGTEKWLPATVPGGVHTDLLALEMIPDPFVGDHELDVMWVAEKDWAYQTTFTPEAYILDEEKVFLVADGLDTLAKVSLNGKVLGKANNQFRQWRWDIKDALKEGENTLEIVFSGPAAYAAQEQRKRKMKGVEAAIDGGPHLRKAPCQFGWDWGPMLPPIGIWKDIRLEGRSIARLEDVHLRQIHEDGTVNIEAEVKVERWKEQGVRGMLRITGPDGKSYKTRPKIIENGSPLKAKIVKPQLWWPKGYGEQNLYDIAVILISGDLPIDKKDFKIGLRTIELVQEDDEFGKSFQFKVNGISIFAKGSNWIPADSFITRFSDERLGKLIADAAASHQNMLRIWGGGFYEEERFYDLCDKYGILVWQDFIFSCSIYPLDEPGFHENVRIEVEENIQRLRHRASLALWCGNNEMEWGWESWGWQKHPLEETLPDLIEQYPPLAFLKDMLKGRGEPLPDWKALKEAYDQFFHHTLPEWVGNLDPDTPYWPSSPSSGIPFYDANSQSQGDAHYWDVWHGRKPFTAYRETYPRFMSEFGFQAFPTMETIDFYAQSEDRNLTSYIMEHHQRGNHGNGLIIAQMTDTFRMPENFTAWIYLSLVLQAEGIRFGVEHWRRHMHRVAGTLYWQLNDCWPVASWASIDYFGRWKALHYAARRFYAPVLLSVEDRPPKMDIHISNDLAQPWEGTIKWSLETLTGEVLGFGEQEVVAAPLKDTLITSLNFAGRVTPENERQVVLITEQFEEEERTALSVYPFLPTKHLELEEPQLEVAMRKSGDLIDVELTAQSLARFVELKLDEAPETVFSDNYFDVPAGRTIEISYPIPEDWSSDRAKKALKVYSLYNSFTNPREK